MFNQLLSQIQTKTQEIKKKFDNIIVEAQTENGAIKIKATANKQIIDIYLSEEILSNKETLEDLLVTTINKAMQKADEIQDKEKNDITNQFMPDFGNIFGK